LREWLNIFQNKYVFITTINKITDQKKDRILFSKPYPKSLNMEDYTEILSKHRHNFIQKYLENKKNNKNLKIEKIFEMISFNRPLSLHNGLKLPTNENINNKKIIKMNRPFDKDEYPDQLDHNTPAVLNIEGTKMEKYLKIQETYAYIQLYIPIYLYMLNKGKFTRNFIEKVTHLVQNLYNKEVVFNFVNLKKMHLSSDIYTQAVALKLKNRNNKLYRVLKSSLRKIKISDFRKIDEKKNKPNKDEFIDNKIRNSLVNSMFTTEQEDVKDPLNNLLLKFFPSAENLKKSVVKKGYVNNYSISLIDYVLMYLKHIKFRGIRVEAKGRLTRRFTASRSVFKMK